MDFIQVFQLDSPIPIPNVECPFIKGNEGGWNGRTGSEEGDGVEAELPLLTITHRRGDILYYCYEEALLNGWWVML